MLHRFRDIIAYSQHFKRSRYPDERDRQATVVGRLLTTLGDDRRAVARLFSVQRLKKSSRGNYAYVWRYSNFVFVW